VRFVPSFRRAAPVAVAFAALAMGGCDAANTRNGQGSIEAPSAPSPVAHLSLSVLPNPVVVLQDPRDPSAHIAQWTVQIVETGGVGGAVSFVNATVRDALTGAPVEPQGFLSVDAAEIQRQVGTDHIAAGGTLVLMQSLAYSSAESSATLAVAVQAVDDNGNLVGTSVTVPVD
jgi:hypothetical protein